MILANCGYYLISIAAITTALAQVPHDLGINFILTDETKVDYLIGNIVDQTKLFPKEQFLRQAHYINILTAHPNVSTGDYFVVKPRGDLITSRPIDRDEICKSLACCLDLVCSFKFLLHFISETSGEKIGVKVEIEIFDVNDNDPIFPTEKISLEVEENFKEYRLSGPWKYPLPLATDKDSLDNSVIKYELIGSPLAKSLFQVSTESLSEVYLEFVKHSILDYEKDGIQSFDMQLVAWDGGLPSRKGSLAISITIIDLDDNKPTFDRDLITRHDIAEGTMLEGLLIKLSASDQDRGRHGKLVYRFLNATDQNGLVVNSFSFNNATGELRLREPLDYEALEETSFALTFQVSSGLLGSLTDEISIEVNVIDVNDNSPMLDDAFPLRIPESTIPMHIIDKINVTDLDRVSIGKVMCSLIDKFDDTFDLQFISSSEFVTTFELLLLKQVDFESVNRINLRLSCRDNALPQKQVTLFIPVDIIDVNDNRPIFKDFFNTTNTQHIFEVAEDFPIGNRIFKFNIHDADLQQNTRINFVLIQDNETTTQATQRFPIKVDKYKGILYLTNNLDYETCKEYNFTIIVYDNEKPDIVLSNMLNITLKVLNVNDNKPSLQAPINGNIVISENEDVPRKITRLEFVDRDFNDTFRIRFDSNDSPDNLERVKEHFSIIDDSLVLIKNIDRERIPSIDVHVACYDNGQPQLKGSAIFTIIISDVNDNPPRMIFPVNNSLIESLIIQDPGNSVDVVTKLIFDDPDVGNNSLISSELIGDFNGTGYFQLGIDRSMKNHESFYLMVSQILDLDQVYQVGLRVWDHGSPKLISHWLINIRATRNSSKALWLSDQEYNSSLSKRYNVSSNGDNIHDSIFSRNLVTQALVGGLIMIFSAGLLSILVAIFIWTRERQKSHGVQDVNLNPGRFHANMSPCKSMQQPHESLDRNSICQEETMSFLNGGQEIHHDRIASLNRNYTNPNGEQMVFDHLMQGDFLDTGQSLILISSNDILMSSNYPDVKSAYHFFDTLPTSSKSNVLMTKPVDNNTLTRY